MVQFRVFVGAPSAAGLRLEPAHSYNWQTVSSTPAVVLPQATLEAAGRRISLIYQNIIFDETDGDNDNDNNGGDESIADQTTLISWPPTASRTNIRLQQPSILDCSVSHVQSTQETEESISYNYSDASSIARFPAFQFSLHSITPLSALSNKNSSCKVSVLLAALEVEGPDTITIRKGTDAGKQVSILKLILGDEDGMVCKLTAWREIAEMWGGTGQSLGVKRGDVVFIENVMVAYNPSTSPTLTASPYLKSRLEICFRTMPYTHEDNRLRPDLRLGSSDAAVKKVASIVNWFQRMAGL